MQVSGKESGLPHWAYIEVVKVGVFHPQPLFLEYEANNHLFLKSLSVD